MDKPVALVTGANRGIGWHVARGLADRGYFVLLGCRSLDRGQSALADLRIAGGAGDVLNIDLGEIDSIDRAVTTIATRYGRLDVLVNNAGVFAHPEDLSLSSLDIATLDQIIRSNLTGPIWITRACLPMLIKCTGRVVNVTSDMARYDTADGTYLAYRITKAGLDAFTANLAMQVRDTGTLVNGVDPGWVRTEMGGRDAPDSPEDAANLVVWAATLPAGALSGVVFCSEKNAPPTPVRTIPIIPVASES